MNTYSVEEAAAIITGSDSPAKVRWVRVRLCRGEFTGYKASRKWRMTEEDVAAAVKSLRPKHVPTVPHMQGLTRTSARRLSA